MPDLLVKLYDLPETRPVVDDAITIRPVMAAEVSLVAEFVETTFSSGWKDEFLHGAYATPVGSIIATRDGKPIGFACFDASAPGLFGPTGVHPDARGENIGAALLFAALDAMKAVGYLYAIIGGAGPVEFYEKLAGATVIPDSDKRYIHDLLR